MLPVPSVRMLIACVHCVVCGDLHLAVMLVLFGVTFPGIMPSVLFLVTLLWTCFVSFNFCLAVGLLDVTMGGKSVMRGIVMIGASSITLCSSICRANHSLFATLCSSMGGVGCNKSSIFCAIIFNNCFLFGVLLATLVASTNSFISALRCLWGFISGSWQCCGNNSVDPDTR